ncbi:centromere protein H [Porphyrio hochstetteri]
MATVELPQGEPSVVEAPDWSEAPEKDVNVVLLLRLKDQIQQQLAEYSTVVQAGQENYLDRIMEENLTTECVGFVVCWVFSSFSAKKGLEEDLEKIKVVLQNKMLALKRIQIMDALRNKIRQYDNDSRKIMETVGDILKLSMTVIDDQLQVREKERELADIKKKRYFLKKAGEQKLLRIHALMKLQKEKQASTEVSRVLESNLQKEKESTTVIQNIFQSIIIGSKVNWAEDPYLKAIVLQLEKNIL